MESARLLQAARLSRKHDDSTGIEKQDAAAQRYADAMGHEIIDRAEDTDVSGSVAPWARPGLGSWLTEPRKMVQYDGIIASALDRLGRNARHLSALRDWAEDHGKKLVVISPALQWPPEDDDFASPIIWDVLGRLAEYELKAITKRFVDTKAYLQANGFLSTSVPYPCEIIPIGKRKTIAPHPVRAERTRQAIARYLDEVHDYSLTQVCAWLDSQGWLTPTDEERVAKGEEPTGAKWAVKTLAQLFRNPCLVGRHVTKEGRTLIRFDEIIETGTWRKLQLKLDRGASRGGRPTKAPSLLKGILRCGVCGGTTYRMNTRSGPYYRCTGKASKSECKVMVRLSVADEFITNAVMAFATEPHMTEVFMPGNIYVDDVLDVEQRIQELAVFGIDDDDFDNKMQSLREERRRLKSLPGEPDRVEYVPSGQTVGEWWAEADTEAQRKFLSERGCTLTVRRHRGVDDLTGKPVSRPEFQLTWRDEWESADVES